MLIAARRGKQVTDQIRGQSFAPVLVSKSRIVG